MVLMVKFGESVLMCVKQKLTGKVEINLVHSQGENATGFVSKLKIRESISVVRTV